ncbi:arylsulfatase [Actinopolymorpha singaporensis]|uniref:Arylsulfatase A n=1 Tax=Actinopolymorpha singaporensis TaxID=117157 RepID=A0A1H1SLU2_9ACTN|nr:arylsulfatase [Actinopolymorpha singaporensis]SDS48349.1 Arylsulfatase A [Actinopolymorpha singaporensis]
MSERPNVILVCVDQWRGDCLSVEDHPVVHTPHLDRLAARGARFPRAYSATPTCVPARMALLTGLSQTSHRRVGYQDGVPFDVETTLPGEFRRNGYQTQAIGKMHYAPTRARLGFDDVRLHDGYLHHSRRRARAVETFDDYLPWLREQAGQSAVSDYVDNGLNCNSYVARPWDKAESLHPTNWIATETISWLYRRDPTVPFFLYLSFHRPHPPFDPPAWAFEQYLHQVDAEPPVGDWWEEYAEHRDDRNLEGFVARFPPEAARRARAGYYGHMAHIDLQLNRIVEALTEFELGDDTYVCFVADHGDMLGDHNLYRKGFPYEGSARIPFLLAGSGTGRGVRREEVVELRDVMPTLLDCAGLDIPAGVEGRSVLGLARGEPVPNWRPYLHGEHALLGQSLQWLTDGRQKYVWMSGTGAEQLFDLVDDPRECHNLAPDPAHGTDLHRWRETLVRELAGRPEGYVKDGLLVPGCPPMTVLPEPLSRPDR